MNGYRFADFENYKQGCDVLLALLIEGILPEKDYKYIRTRLDRLCAERDIVQDLSDMVSNMGA